MPSHKLGRTTEDIRRDVYKRQELEEYMQGRHSFVSSGGAHLCPVEGVSRTASIVCPIIAESDVTGAVVVLQPESGTVPGETETKLAQVAASFLGRQMES